MIEIDSSCNDTSAFEDIYACDHDRTLVFFVNAAGAKVYYQQCVICGHKGNAISKSSLTDYQIKGADEGNPRLREQWEQDRYEAYQNARRKKRQAWFLEYDKYLQSSQWKTLRLRVLERCEYVCEGCRTELAVEVHHLTYEHVGDEQLFELVGLCKNCHEKIKAGSTNPFHLALKKKPI